MSLQVWGSSPRCAASPHAVGCGMSARGLSSEPLARACFVSMEREMMRRK
jgi:hypothetical protein